MAHEYARGFYNSPEWRRCRKAYIQSVFGLCERCSRPGDIVHHKTYITPDNIDDPDITLNHDNLELLCHDCHNKEHKLTQTSVREDLRFNEFGELEKV